MKKVNQSKAVKHGLSAILLGSLLIGQSSLILAQETIHIVSHGEFLYQIAQKYGVTVKDLQSWNHLSSNVLYTGDRLIVSKPEASTEAPTTTTTPAPTPTETTQASPSPSAGTYTVKAGDSLYSIAKAHGLTVDQVKTWNKLSSNLIRVGQTLNLSQPTTPSPETTTEAPTTTVTTGKVYTVQKGDYLYKIAGMYGVTVNQLKTWNKLTSNLISAGQKLIVAQPTTPTPETTTEAPTTTVTTGKVYTVQKGDYLYKIAGMYGVTVDQVKTWNKLSSNLIHVGQKLYVSKPVTSPTTPSPTPVQPAPTTNSKYHIVKAGESITLIAAKYEVTADQIRQWNKLTSDLIHPNDKLIVGQAVTNPTPTPVDKVHTVKAGESIYIIANKYGVTASQIRQWNQLTSNLIHPNDRLYVSKPATTYTVKAGDYLYKIASQYGVTVNQIKTWNNLTSNYIYVGDKLIIKN